MNAAQKIRRHDLPKYLKPEAARISRASRVGVSQRELADDLGVDAGYVGRMELAHEPHAPTVLHVAGAPERNRPWAEGLIRWQAAKQDLQVLRAARIVHGDNHGVRLSVIVSEVADVLRVFAAAMADGHLTDDELELLDSESREAAEALLELNRYVVVTLQSRRSAR